jgi:glycosyltransferase involved in cell wall biosynthesis
MRAPAAVLIVGDGPERGRLERLAARLGVDRVRFLGFLPHAVVAGHMCHADVLALPSVYEELGSVLVEALQAGLPIVASRVGGIPAVVEHGRNGLLVRPGDAHALAAALDAVLLDPALARTMGQASRTASDAYRWDALAQRVLGVYRQVAEP